MEFSRQEYWSRLPFPSPVDFPNPGIKPKSLCIGRQILYRCVTWVDRELIDAIINYVDTCNKKVLPGEKKKTPDLELEGLDLSLGLPLSSFEA